MHPGSSLTLHSAQSAPAVLRFRRAARCDSAATRRDQSRRRRCHRRQSGLHSRPPMGRKPQRLAFRPRAHTGRLRKRGERGNGAPADSVHCRLLLRAGKGCTRRRDSPRRRWQMRTFPSRANRTARAASTVRDARRGRAGGRRRAAESSCSWRIAAAGHGVI
jgi:hypothetical protein